MSERPNILIFNPDQWRGDVLGHVGNPAAITPNLDDLVKTDAVSFTNSYCQNPVCTPSRCSFMTGWYPHVRGHRTMYHMLHAERGEPNLLKILKDEGYFVWWGGKNDLTPGQFGYDDYCHVKYAPKKEDLKRWGVRYRKSVHVADKWWRGEENSDTYYSFFAGKLDKGTDDVYFDIDWGMILGAVDFIHDLKQEEMPFCIFLPLLNPHPPYAVEEPWFSMINRKLLPPRIQAPETWEKKPSILKGIHERQHMQGWSEERWTELRATYYGMCARLDHQFGMIIKALKDKGMYDNTMIFFFADHGDFTGDFGLVEKTQNTFEDCLVRVPFLIKPPATIPVKPGVRDALVELIDFPATVYDVLTIEPNYSHFGKSLIPLLTGERNEHRDAVFAEGGRLKGEKQAMELESLSKFKKLWPKTQYWPRLSLQISDDGPYHTKAAMCRTKQYKYVRRLYETDELYDLKNDPQELTNLIDDPNYKEILQQFKERMLTWYMETCDVVPHETDKRF